MELHVVLLVVTGLLLGTEKPKEAGFEISAKGDQQGQLPLTRCSGKDFEQVEPEAHGHQQGNQPDHADFNRGS